MRARARRTAPGALAALALLCACASPASAAGLKRRPEYRVGITTVRFTEHGKFIRLKGKAPKPRVLRTVVRYPAGGPAGAPDLPDAAPRRGRYPLVVFAHGYGVTPETYSALLNYWARSGFVVAAPYFPRTSAGAPGGLDADDVFNQPGDVSAVINGMESRSRTPARLLTGVLSPGKVAVAGHSDGGETALAAAYAWRYRDRRIRAALVFSGARLSGIGGYDFAAGTPPLLAAQGTADHLNEPHYTYEYFEAAHRPKFLLRLNGAGHLPPFKWQQPQLGLVERTSAAFLERYLLGSVTSTELVDDAWLPPYSTFTALP